MDSSVTTLPDERLREIRHHAGQFTLELVKALVQTGYYSSEHPSSRTVAHDLYQLLQEVTRDAYELTYVLVSTVDERGVMIEGLTHDPIEVARALTGTMGDHFVAKLHDYFVRNRIASFTIKRHIEEPEFTAFLGLWVTWATRVSAVEGRTATAIMAEELDRAGIFGVTVVGMDEVPGQARHLPWQTRLTLARLRTDLGRLTELRRARPEALAQLKAQAVLDAIRAIRRSTMVAEVLLHADLVTETVPAFAPAEVEHAIAEAIPASFLLAVTSLFLDWFETEQRHATGTTPPGRDPTAHRDAVERSARLVAARLARLHVPDSDPLLERAHGLGLIELQALPEEIRRKFKARDLCDRFLESSAVYLRDFESCAAPKSYLKYLNVFAVILPELVRREEAAAVGSILAAFDRHLKEEAPPFVGRTRFIEETLALLERGGAVAGLVDLACRTPKETRAGLEAGVALFRGRAVPELVARLGAEDVSERAAAVSILQHIGADAVPAVLEELRSHRHPWFTVRNLIAILGNARVRTGLSVLRQFMRHPHPKVREELVQTFALVLGDEAEKALIPFLDDDSPVVVRKAIHHLGAIRCTAPAFLKRVHEAVRLRSRSEEEPDAALQAACLTALAQYEYQLMPETPDIEGTLIEVVHPSPLRARLPSRFGIRPKPVELLVLAIRALGALGTGRSLAVLGDLMASRSDELRQAAIEAVEQIRGRLTSQVTQSPLKF